MLLTPTYHVFEMYKVHHDATLLPSSLTCTDYVYNDRKLPSLNASVSRDQSGKVHISICNLDPNHEAGIECELRGMQAEHVSGRVLTAPEMNTHNTFEDPEQIRPAIFKSVKLKKNLITATLPAKSVVVLEVE